MTLVADKRLTPGFEEKSVDLNAAIGRWRYSSPSAIGHHGKSCCSTAREWMFATDHSLLNGQDNLMGPRWVLQRYDWGPSQWPMTWCFAVQQEVLDCGALAAISKEVFTARGVVSHSIQLIQEYTDNTTYHWAKAWTEHPASTHWIQGALIYHEACAVEIGSNEIRLWDPSAGCWINPKPSGGYGSIRAIRVRTNLAVFSRVLTWGTYRIPSDEWHIIPTKKEAPQIHLI